LVEKSTRHSRSSRDTVPAALVAVMATEQGSYVAQETIPIHNAFKKSYGIVL
jgi:hypothetical protein